MGNESKNGAAVFTDYDEVKIENSIFTGLNYATNSYGGGVVELAGNSLAFVTNCTFNNNGNNAGNMLNCRNILADNFVENLYIKNNIFWNSNPGQPQLSLPNHAHVEYNDIQGGYAGLGNINLNPQFNFSGVDFNVYLQGGSPCINAGSPVITTPINDFKGFGRTGRFDLGAYEYCNTASIISQPSSTTAVVGTTVSFSIVAKGSSLHYQWKRNGTNVGGNSNILTMNNITAADAGNYTCEVSNLCNSITSSIAPLSVNPTQTIYYVRSELGSNNNNGSSWLLAKRDLQEAINLAQPGDWIWVKAGTYKPTRDPFGSTTPANARNKTFYLKNGVKIFGGFAGTETLLSQRNPATNVTILSGDLGSNSPATITDDAFHVLLSVYDNINTLIDGFTIQYGNATGGGSNLTVESANIPQNFGGGMCNFGSWPTINNCIFKSCVAQTGGAMQNTDYTFASINRCTFIGNIAKDTGGGAVANEIFSDPTFTNCVFSDNAANGSPSSAGGAIFVNNGGNCSAQNCVFNNNVANNLGGAVCVRFNSTTDIKHATFYNNAATGPSAKGAGIYYAADCTGSITNSLFHNNTTPAVSTDTGRESIYSDYTGTGSNALVTANSCLISDATSSPLAITNLSLNSCQNGNPQFANFAVR